MSQHVSRKDLELSATLGPDIGVLIKAVQKKRNSPKSRHIYERRDAELEAICARRLGRGSAEFGQREKQLANVRLWAKSLLTELSKTIDDVSELKDIVVRRAYDRFVPTDQSDSAFWDYPSFEAALWEEGYPSLDDFANEALKKRGIAQGSGSVTHLARGQRATGDDPLSKTEPCDPPAKPKQNKSGRKRGKPFQRALEWQTLRQTRGISQDAMASECRVSIDTIYRAEYGRGISLKSSKKICAGMSRLQRTELISPV